jgi:hypothetical protein
VSSSREGETPQPLEEKKDECLPVSHSVSAENQPPQLDRWQPNSTAPIGVTEVLLCWQDGVSAPMFKTGYNLGDGRRWQDTHQWLHNEHSWPTHWMPLPPPPECVDCEAILRRDPPFGVALALPNPPEADKPSNEQSSAFSDRGETPAAPVEPRGLRPAICDPEHYPEDAAYAQPIKQRTGPLCSIHPDYREPCLMCKRAGIGEAPRLPAGAP